MGKTPEQLKEEEDKAIEKAVKSKKAEEKAAIEVADKNNLKDAMAEDKAIEADHNKVLDEVKEIHDGVKLDAADLKAARKETITAEHANMTDEDYIKNLPEHHMPSWIASYNANKTIAEEAERNKTAEAAKAEAAKKSEDAE